MDRRPGFLLKLENICFLKAANVHQDQAGWGDAVTEAAMRRDVRMMKEAGFDLIRGSHYPHGLRLSQKPAMKKACSSGRKRLSGVSADFSLTGIGTPAPYPASEKDYKGFEESALQQLKEMIRIHRNHPSIVTWSMCNEAFFSTPEAIPGVRHLLERMVKLSRQLDPTRPAAIGGAQRPLGKDRIDLIET